MLSHNITVHVAGSRPARPVVQGRAGVTRQALGSSTHNPLSRSSHSIQGKHNMTSLAWCKGSDKTSSIRSSSRPDQIGRGTALRRHHNSCSKELQFAIKRLPNRRLSMFMFAANLEYNPRCQISSTPLYPYHVIRSSLWRMPIL